MTAPAEGPLHVRHKTVTATAARRAATCGGGNAERTRLRRLGRTLDVAIRDGHGIGIEEQIRWHVRLGNVAEVGPQTVRAGASTADGHGQHGNHDSRARARAGQMRKRSGLRTAA